MEITIDELYTYLHCPAKYDFKFNQQMEAKEQQSILFKEALHKTIYYFFFSVMNERMPTLAQLKDKWAHTYLEVFGETFDKNDIFKTTQVQKNRRDPLQIKGIEMLHNFYHFNKDNPGVPIAVNQEYRVPVGNLVIKGTFELVREIVDPANGRRYIELVDFKTTDKSLDYFAVKNDLSLTIASFAFRNLFRAKEDRTKYHYMNTGRDIIVPKDERDYKRLEAIVSGVSRGIVEQHYYPRQTYMCRTCEFKEICDKTNF